MDPRFRERRIEVRRFEGRRRLRVLVVITLVTAGAAGAWGATRSPLLDVDHITVQGAYRTPVEEVITAAAVRLGQPLADVDRTGAGSGVEALPWVGAARVERRWPGRVLIVVTERSGAAVVAADGGGFAVVDGTGRVLEVVESPPDGLIPLTAAAPAGGPGSRLAPESMAALTVAAALPPSLLARTAGVGPATSDPREVELRLKPEGIVRLGAADDLDRKFDALTAVMAQVDLGNLTVLDVRRPEVPVLTRRSAPAKVSTPRTG